MDKTPLTRKIEKTISPMAETMGYEIVRVLLVGIGSGKPTLQIMAERPDGTMHLDDCSRLSQAVSAILDVENVMAEAYYLEVSSPGIDRPLTRLKDFDRYKGLEARVEIEPGIDGRKKFKGRLLGVEKDVAVSLKTDEGDVYSLPFEHIQRAKLTLNDELLKAAQQKKG
ncbi:MAG: ribosome maturation factor RimP [Alphaproteobacteria bacterium]